MQERDLFGKRIAKSPPALERDTQIMLADTLDKYHGLSDGWEWFHVPNGELRADATGALLKRMGAKAGVLDMEFLSPDGRPYFLELKRGRAPLSEEQKAFIDRQFKRGVTCAVARSYKEAVQILKDWGAMKQGVKA